MKANQAVFPIKTMARGLGVSRAGYYAWARRHSSARAEADRELLRHIAPSMSSRTGRTGRRGFMPK